MPDLPQVFLQRPITHRALHDIHQNRPENSLAAIRAAVSAGYGIEIDLQLSRDAHAMVFHDDELDRLTAQTGPVRARDAASLGAIPLRHGTEGIPGLTQVLDLVDGQVPLLIELKDQHGDMGDTDGALETATLKALETYKGSVALMSFNPHMVRRLDQMTSEYPLGLTTSGYHAIHWPELSDETRHRLRDMPDLDTCGARFISHDRRDLDSPQAARAKAKGLPILCWTIKSPEQEALARKIADNITFEGYAA